MHLIDDLYGPVRNVFDAVRYITWASGRGLGPGNGEFFGPCEMASSQSDQQSKVQISSSVKCEQQKLHSLDLSNLVNAGPTPLALA